MGWNLALEELNRVYFDNIVPDRLVEASSENTADIVIAVYSVKEYCCDLANKPVTAIERSRVDGDSAKILSNVSIYNIGHIDVQFLADVTRHELGHTLGLFKHVTNRSNDLMSIISPANAIKTANLNDLYVKYRDRTIISIHEARASDQENADSIADPFAQ